jgi:hypothetical protein
MAKSQELQKDFGDKMNRRKASLTSCEEAFLHALLIDPVLALPAKLVSADGKDTKGKVMEDVLNARAAAPELVQHQKQQDGMAQQAVRVLDDDMLFSVPPPELLASIDEPQDQEETRRSRHVRRRARQQQQKMPQKHKHLVGLWQAFEDGVSPKQLLGLARKTPSTEEVQPLLVTNEEEGHDAGVAASNDVEDEADNDSVKSDDEVRLDNQGAADSISDDESWEEGKGDVGLNHFDTWQLLKDEYAKDFGFDYTPDGTIPSLVDSDIDQHKFAILGTSADDIEAHPHVLSPPLMDSLLSFVPENVSEENLWLKYSLVRDGASLTTLKRYVRASPNTIVAIETTTGHVFGSFTSSPWRTQPGLYGGNPAFVWKMRYDRNEPCHSLIEQAQLESEIDVHLLFGDRHMVQCSTHKMLGIGEGEILEYDEFGNLIESELGDNLGFAIALSEDLLSGTTSQCPSFKNPCLTNPDSRGEPFKVLNLEVWAFTPCMTVEAAERLEMSHFYITESMRNLNSSSFRSHSRNPSIMSQFSSASASAFGSEDFDQEKFYRRVGHGDENEANRERWQYRNMMDGGGGAPGRGIGGSPRFTNA